MAKVLLDAARGTTFRLDPDEVVIVGLDTDDGPEHALYDKRITLPLDEDMIAGIMVFGVLTPIRVVVIEGVAHVTDGRQRVRNAREAIARLTKRGEVAEVLIEAKAEKLGDEDRQAQIGIITNEHRFGDSPLIRAAKMQQLIDRGIDVKRIALLFRVSVATVQANLKLSTLSAPVKKAIEAGTISPTAAATLADLPKAEQAAKLEAIVATPGRASVAKAKREIDPSKPRPRTAADLRAALARIGEPSSARESAFADGLRYALGILEDANVPSILVDVLEHS